MKGVNKAVIAIIVIIAIIGIGYFYMNSQKPVTTDYTNVEPAQPTNNADTPEEKQVLSELSQDSRVKNYIDTNPSYSLDITLLDQTELDRLKGEQPAIYDSSVGVGSYKVYYSAGSSGLLVIYNPAAKQILKIYPVQNLVL